VVGDEVRLFAEFELLAEIGSPMLVVRLGDGTNRVVQRMCERPAGELATESCEQGRLLQFRQTFTLCVPPGVAVIDVELASFTSLPVVGREIEQLYEDDRLAGADRHCFVRAAAIPLVVRAREDAPAADCRIRFVSCERRDLRTGVDPTRSISDMPTLFHVTHWKAGSQWVYAILRELFPSRIVPPMAGNYQIHHWPIAAGKVYPTVYATKPELDSAAFRGNARNLVVLRDPRDALISYYFSVKFSHAVALDRMAHDRELIRRLDVEDGLLIAVEYWMQGMADIHSTWLASGEPIVRYEDLVRDDFGTLKAALLDHFNLPITEESLRAAIEACRFERLSGGRRQGQEDSGSHYRKGVAGDWQNHFTPRITAAFKRKFGDLLVAGGYERDHSW
jgi:lipopolysaccharide transport system ATP-binding protein